MRYQSFSVSVICHRLSYEHTTIIEARMEGDEIKWRIYEIGRRIDEMRTNLRNEAADLRNC